MILPPGPYRRVAVTGPCGSGKSTVARRIAAVLGIPVVHIDQLHHAPGWQPRPADAFAADLAAAVAAPKWVIDGNHFGLGAARFARADLIVLLDLPRRLTVPRVLRRIVTQRGRVRPDSAPGCPERLDLAFLWYVWRWNASKRSTWLAAVTPCADRAVRVTSDAAVARLIAELAAAAPPRGSYPSS